MSRRLSALLALALLAVTAAPAAGGSGAPIATGDDVAPPQPLNLTLDEGDTYEGTGYDLTAAGILVEASPDLTGVSEVRVGLAFRNTTTSSLPVWTPSIDDAGFPTVSLRDDLGTIYAPDLIHPARAVAAGADVDSIEPGMSVRWTIGFQVPTERTERLTFVATDGATTAEWTFGDEDVTPSLPMPTLPSVSLGDTIDYEPGVAVTPRATGAMVCGDPAIEPVAHLFTVAFDVRNDTLEDVRWPSDIYAGPAPVVQWADGASAEMSLETFWGEVETLPRVGGHAVMLPPVTSAARAIVFAAPRDGRFVDIETLPQGVRLPTAGGDVWLDLADVEPTIGLDPAICDLGSAGAPVPFAYGPGQKFQVGGEVQPSTGAERDAAALQLITTAIAAVGLFYDANGETLASFDEDDFLAVAPTLEIIDIRAGVSRPLGVPGIIYFDTDRRRPAFLFVATRSASGTWFCAGGDLFTVPATATGARLADVGPTCYPSAYGS